MLVWLRRALVLAAVVGIIALALWWAREACRMSADCPWTVMY